MNITEKQKDALTELVNISFSKAANALSELTGQRVHLDVPSVEIYPVEQLGEVLSKTIDDEVASVHQLFKGQISGDAMLLVNTKSSLILNDLLVGNEQGTTLEFDNSTREVLVEVGNIILNSCLGMFGNLLQVQFTFSVPQLKVDSISNMMTTLDTGEETIRYALFIYMGFRLKQSNIDGYLVVVLGVSSMDYFILKIEELVNLN
jgi:chemotaxis protein CheC